MKFPHKTFEIASGPKLLTFTTRRGGWGMVRDPEAPPYRRTAIPPYRHDDELGGPKGA